MAGPQPSAIVVAMSTIVGVAMTGFVVSVLGAAGGAGANLPIPVINGTAAPQADEVGPPAAIELPHTGRSDGNRSAPDRAPEADPGNGPHAVLPPPAQDIGAPDDPGTGAGTPPPAENPGENGTPPVDPGAPGEPASGHPGNGNPGNSGNGNPGNGNQGNQGNQGKQGNQGNQGNGNPGNNGNSGNNGSRGNG